MADGMRITCRWCSHERISRVIPAKSIVKLTIHSMTEYLLLINIRDVDIDISTTVLLLHLLNQSIHLDTSLAFECSGFYPHTCQRVPWRRTWHPSKRSG